MRNTNASLISMQREKKQHFRSEYPLIVMAMRQAHPDLKTPLFSPRSPL